MAKEEKIILSVDTASSAKSVTELQKILKAAKDELIAAKEGSDQYKKALEVAAEASEKLRKANEDIKKSMPITETQRLKEETKANAKAAKEASDAAKVAAAEQKAALKLQEIAQKALTKEVQAAEKANAKLAASAPTATIKALRREIIEAKSAMLEAEEGSVEYAAALKRAADASFKMREMNEEIKNSAGDVGEALGNTTKVMGGLLQGATAVTAGMQLFGIENEGLVEGIARLQQISAIAQGVQGMEGLGKSMKALSLNIKGMTAGTWLAAAAQKAWNLVMSANPIMLIVAAVAVLVTGLIGLYSWLSKNNEEQEKNNRLMAEFEATSARISEQREYNIKVMKAEGATQDEIYQKKIQDLNLEYDRLRAESARVAAIKDKTDADIDYMNNLTKQMGDTRKLIKKEYEDWNLYTIEKRRKDREQAEQEEQKRADEQKAKREKRTQEQIDADRKAKEEAEKIRQDELKSIEAINEAIRQRQLSELDKLNEKYQSEKELFEKHQKDITQITLEYESERAAIEKSIADQKQAEQDRLRQSELEAMSNNNSQAIENIDKYWTEVSIRDTEARTNKEITEREYQSRQHATQIAHLESLLESEAINADQEIQLRQQLADAKKAISDAEIQHRRSIVSQIGALADVAAELAGKETAAGKGLAIAAATISTFQAAQQGYLSAFMPTPTLLSPILGGLNVAAAIAVGFKNIKAIQNTKIPGKASASSGGGLPSAPAIPTAPNVPQSMQPTRNVNTQTEVDLQAQPVKAYVVETDIKGVQSRANMIQSESTF